MKLIFQKEFSIR